MQFTTTSGSRYEIVDNTVRRVNVDPDLGMRGDDIALTLHNQPIVEVGFPVLLITEPLSSYGPDSYGTANPHANVTERLTTAVVSITP